MAGRNHPFGLLKCASPWLIWLTGALVSASRSAGSGMEHFTPYSATVGGVLIGLAAIVLMAFHGRIAGISGIVGGLLAPRAGDVAWRAAFVIGMIAAAAALAAAGLGPALRDRPGVALIVIAGLLVGFGTRLGSGCTSGHGVCGLARLSTRSLVATLVFMASAAAVVFVARHVFGA
jgi:uncharacterized membrane protein YedE/YeeE